MRALYLAAGRDLACADAGATHTLNIARAFVRAGVDVTLAVAGQGQTTEKFRIIEVPRHSSWINPLARPPRTLVDAALEADIIQERAEESGGAGIKLASQTRKPLVLEMNTPISGHANPIVRRFADWNLMRQATAASAIITQTPLSRSMIETYAYSPVFVVPNGADAEAFSPTVSPIEIPGIDPAREIVAFAGSLRPWHGVEDLIAAGGDILRRHSKAFFLFIGGGEREDDLRKMAHDSLGRGNCHFTGRVHPSQVPRYLAMADVLVAPFSPQRDPVRRSQFARFGMWWCPVKIFEYMAMQKPIVASEAGMVAEYTAGAALTYPPSDTAALAGRVCQLLEDGSLAQRLAEAARKRLLMYYTWDAAASATIAAWQDVLRKSHRVSLMR